MFFANSAVFFLGLCFVANGNVVDFIDPCHINDNVCVKASSIKVMQKIVGGMEKLGIPPMDPMVIKEVDASSGSLILKFIDLIVTKISKCNLLKVERPEEYKVNVVMECPITARGKYKADGTFLDQGAIYGSGDFELDTENIRFEISVNMKSAEGADGKQHLKITKFDYKYDPIAKMNMKFHNLYNGEEEEKAKIIHALVEQTGNDLFRALGKNVVANIMKECIGSVVGKLFSIVPRDELELI